MIWIIIALLIFIFQIATILIAEFRHPSKAVAWLLILFVFPVIGFVMYYFLAKSFQRRRTVRKRGIIAEEVRLQALRRSKLIHRASELGGGEFVQQERLFHLLQQFPYFPITGCNKTDILNDGEQTYEAILAAIGQAKHHIHLEYYTVRDDEIGRRFKEALIDKARAGVQVRLIYDGVGSYDLSASYIGELADAGVMLQCFLPPRNAFFEKRINYRNHRKIVVIDGLVGFVGGINIGDEYLGKDKKLGYWRDTHLQITGDAVYSLQDVFMRDWWFTSRERLSDPAFLPEHHCRSDEQVQIVSSGPDSSADAILECMFNAIAVAKSRIYITTPYFIPDSSILMGLRTAALSGVDVRIIIPEVSDSKLVMFASLSYVEDLLASGIRVYRYRKGFIHSKVLIVDKLLASVGTANMDMRSFFSNFELNALLFDKDTMDKLEAEFMNDIAGCYELKLSEFGERPRWQKASEVAARMLAPLL
ncbi:cardiolipin synthase [Paenibacillus abyssi]|uniref:Cardiolipin synthase n=1 Tax=Paenibacillus abyssi TaxID=1340531 RepID=A0A917G3M7_9BACL|nr:cardiolipin synthase [Paenibacillus abyssi]GGG21497.1 cardiolipin synthase [Paenibacillus abyssi]